MHTYVQCTSFVVLLAVLVTANAMHTHKERYLDRDKPGESLAYQLVRRAAVPCSSALQLLWRGQQTAARSKVLGAFVQNDGTVAQGVVKTSHGTELWHGPELGNKVPDPHVVESQSRGPWRGSRQLLSVRRVLAVDKTDAAAAQQSTDQRRGAPPQQYSSYGPYGSGGNRGWSGGGGGNSGWSGGGSSAWQNAASGGQNWFGRK